MTVALYIRVSTDEQAEHGTSVDMQKDRLQAYATSQGWGDVKLYIDDGYTGTNMDRPSLKRLIRHVEIGKVKTVVVYKLDRLGRKQKDVLHLLEDVFEKHGVAFKSATEPFDTSTPLGKAMLGILAVFAQLERDMIVERTTSGRRHRTSQGIWYGGRVPFGYEWKNGQLVIIPEEARLVQEVYKRYLNGHSRLAIAEWIASRSKARSFDHAVIREMLARPIYMGKLINAGELVDGNHEKIIDDETWYAVQRETAKRMNGIPPIGDYLLTGLLECGECGANIVHVKRRTNKRGKEYCYELYACRNQHVREKERTVPTCKLGYFQRARIENYVVNVIKQYRLNPDMLIVDKADHTPDETVTSLKQKLEDISQSLENLYDAIQSGDIKASRVSDRISRLEEEREAIELQLDELEGEYVVVNHNETFEAIRQISVAWEYLDMDERKVLLRKVIRKITLQKDADPRIHWNI
jgi:site-specific DNA recombinase